MRASVNDFNKVMPVVRDQILTTLNRQPETLEACKKELDQLARTIEIGYEPRFWAADPKGTMSYRTEGGMSVRPSK